jgi:hypothetical protein
MTHGRCFGRLAAATVILLAMAQPGAADGASQFERKIRTQLPPDSFTYANAKSLGDNGLVLEGVLVTPPAEATGGAKAEPVARLCHGNDKRTHLERKTSRASCGCENALPVSSRFGAEYPQ